jgi:hypothetical protein
MPRRGEGKSTEITTLPAGQNLGQMDDVNYFEKKLYKSLSVPVGRLESQSGFSLGRTNEITREELKFDKFIDKLRSRFSILFDELMARQLALKGICTLEEWGQFKQYVHYDFIKDNNFTELKDAELIQNRIQTLQAVQPYIGMFYSKRWVQENVLNMHADDIERMETQMEEEQKESESNPPRGNPTMPQDPMAGQPDAGDDQQQNSAGPQDDQNINKKVSQLIKTGTGT